MVRRHGIVSLGAGRASVYCMVCALCTVHLFGGAFVAAASRACGSGGGAPPSRSLAVLRRLVSLYR